MRKRRRRAHCWVWGQVSLSGLGCRLGTEPMWRDKNKMSEHRAATKTQLFTRCPRAGRRKPLLASCASLPCRDEFVLTRQSWSYPLTSCVSLNCSTLQIHLQSQLQLSEVLFHLKQPTAV